MILEQVQQRPRLLVGQVERHHASRSVEILARLERTIGGAAPGDVAVTGGRLICAAASVPVSDSTEGKWHRLPVEPHILEAPAVEDAVDDKVETLHARPPARRDTGIEDDRARGVARQPALDFLRRRVERARLHAQRCGAWVERLIAGEQSYPNAAGAPMADDQVRGLDQALPTASCCSLSVARWLIVTLSGLAVDMYCRAT